MMVSRVLAVIAALLLVGSFAAATLAPQDLTLGQALLAFDPAKLNSAEQFVRQHMSAWWWDRPAMALLIRPVWVIPAMLGLLFVGGALTTVKSQKAPTSRRRRS